MNGGSTYPRLPYDIKTNLHVMLGLIFNIVISVLFHVADVCSDVPVHLMNIAVSLLNMTFFNFLINNKVE